MLERWSTKEIIDVTTHIERSLRLGKRLIQAKRRERGAWVRPGLAGSVQQLEKALLKSYQQLAQEVIASLRGHADDVVSGRLAQAKTTEATDAEIDAALEFYGVDLSEKEHPVDKSRWAAILALIAIWLTRHQRIAETYGLSLFEQGRMKAIKEAGKTSVAVGPVSRQLQQKILSRYDADIERLRDGLRDGTVRSYGMQWIVESSKNLGEAVLYLRRLMETESYRIGMLAESLAWTSESDGYRAGAIETTQSILKEEGLWREGLTELDLTELQLDTLPKYEFVGPDDERICSACKGQLADPYVYAFSVDELKSPSEICLYGINCRHRWQVVSD